MSGNLLTTTQAAEMLGVSRDTVARWIRLGQLPAVRLPSGQYRVKREDVERVLSDSQT